MEINQNKIVVVIVGVLIGLVAWLGLKGNVGQQVVTVTALAEKVFPVGKARMMVTRIDLGDEVSRLIGDGKTNTETLIEVANKIGGQGVVVKKDFYQVNPQTDGSYMVTNMFVLELSDISKIDALIAGLYEMGATVVGNVSFMAENNRESEDVVIAEAVDMARVKAEAMVRSAGRRLGKVVLINEISEGEVSSVLTGNDLTLSKRLSVSYEIK